MQSALLKADAERERDGQNRPRVQAGVAFLLLDTFFHERASGTLPPWLLFLGWV